MSNYLIDTGLILRHLREEGGAARELAGLRRLGHLSISVVTRIEARARMLPHERFSTQKLLSRFETLDLDKAVADRAGDLLREQARRNRALSFPDAIIAATALEHNLTLVTLNRAHFETIPGLSLAPMPADLT